jgi:hypothetical protein
LRYLSRQPSTNTGHDLTEREPSTPIEPRPSIDQRNSAIPDALPHLLDVTRSTRCVGLVHEYRNAS